MNSNYYRTYMNGRVRERTEKKYFITRHGPDMKRPFWDAVRVAAPENEGSMQVLAM